MPSFLLLFFFNSRILFFFFLTWQAPSLHSSSPARGRPLWALPPLALEYQRLPEGSFFTPLVPPFWQMPPRMTSRLPGTDGLQGVCLQSHRTVYICTLEKLLHEGLAPNQPEFSAEMPLWDTDRSWHTFNHWEPLKMKLAAWTKQKFDRQQRARAGLNNKVHFSQEATPSELGEVTVYLLNRNQPREPSKIRNKGIYSKWKKQDETSEEHWPALPFCIAPSKLGGTKPDHWNRWWMGSMTAWHIWGSQHHPQCLAHSFPG